MIAEKHTENHGIALKIPVVLNFTDHTNIYINQIIE